VTLAEATLNDGQRLVAFNDLFIGATSHVSGRYAIHHESAKEQHSSSGALVSTGAGTTGWLSSVFTPGCAAPGTSLLVLRASVRSDRAAWITVSFLAPLGLLTDLGLRRSLALGLRAPCLGSSAMKRFEHEDTSPCRTRPLV
jgi:hypothetical protein